MIKTKTRIFISYTHAEKDLKDKLELALSKQKDTIEIYSDQVAKAGQPLHKEISKSINHCHIIIPIITKKWLSSHETRDELVRAHERRKHIICFLLSDDLLDLEHIPFYLRETLRIHFNQNNIDFQISELINTIHNYDEYWKLEQFNYIRKLGDLIDEKENLPIYKENHLDSCLNEAMHKISTIIKQDIFKSKISLADNFITDSSPYFKAADTIYAISIADISTFWTDSNSYDAALKYLKEQSGHTKKVVRVFVFKTANEANYFKNILQANYSSYGKHSGGVFITSYTAYNDLLNSISRDPSFLEQIKDVDFGLLLYNNNKSNDYLFASLNKTNFKIETISSDEYLTSSIQLFHETLESLLSIEENSYNKEFDIVRWGNEIYNNKNLQIKLLNKLFPNNVTNLIHLVLINTNENFKKVRTKLETIVNKFIKNKEELEITDIWFYDRHDITVLDGIYQGIINIENQYDFVFGVEFQNKKALKNYYEHRIHSLEREELYKAIKPNISKNYDEIKKIINKKGEQDNLQKQYSEIEKQMSEYIMRVDLSVEESISNIVDKTGISFGSKLVK